MKNNIKTVTLILTNVFFSQVFSQSDITGIGTGHNRSNGYYVGWRNTAGTSGSLDIRNDWNQPINFFTNNTQKATILSNGFVGIGTAAPVNLLHLNSVNAVQVATQFTNSATSATATDGFLTGIDFLGNAILNQQENLPMLFTINTTERMRIATNGNVGIGTSSPNALLHLNSNATPAVRVVTLYSNSAALAANGGFEVGLESSGIGILRHNADQAIEIWTIGGLLLNIRRNSSFTSNRTFGSLGTLDTRGDGLRIHDPNNNGGNLDLWTSSANQTHIVWGPNGRIQGINNRFEIQADFNNGLWFNVVNPAQRTFFNSQGVENARIGANSFWRIGANAANVDAARRLEVFDEDNPQLRLTQSLTGPVRTDFQTTAAGDLYVNPVSNTTSMRVGINTSVPSGKLHIENTTEVIGAFARSNTSSTALKVGVTGMSQGATYSNIGLWGIGSYPYPFLSVVSAGIPGQYNPNTPLNVGVIGQGQGSAVNFGGIFEANQCPLNVRNYGVYASARRGSGSACGIGVAGYFNGNVVATGSGTFNTSDSKFKDSVINLSNALSVIARLIPKQFVFNSSYPSMSFPSGIQYGIIAQQLDTVLPQLVNDVIHPKTFDTTGTMIYDTVAYKAVNYTGLIPWTIRGIQELDSLKVGATCTKADSNHVVKWSTVDKTLVNGQIYDDGSKIGIPNTATNVYVNVSNTGNSYTAGKFEGGSKGLHGSVVGTNVKQHGVFGESKGASVLNVGVEGDAKRSTSAYNVGVSGVADSSSVANIALLGQSTYNTNSATNVGVYTTAANSRSQNVAGQFIATDTFGLNYGVYGEAHSPTSGSPAFAGYFSGNVHATGVVTWSSDATLKNNIADVDSRNALASLLRLSPKTYSYKTSDYPYLDLPQGNQYGLIAQEVEHVFPDLVSDITHPEIKDTEGKVVSPRLQYKGLNYAGLIPILVGAVKQQQTKIDSLQQVIDTRLSEIENRLARCCGSGKTDEGENTGTAETHRINVELSNMQVVVLEQNVPNPFAEQTAINYFIPEDAANAQMLFFDASGKALKTVVLEKGNGIVTVFAGNLSSGTYSYTLLVDGKAIETKRMVKGR